MRKKLYLKMMASLMLGCILLFGMIGCQRKNPESQIDNNLFEDTEEIVKNEPEKVMEVESEEDVFIEMTDEDYPLLLQGNLTKEEFSFILGRAPEMMADAGPSSRDLRYLCFYLACGGGEGNNKKPVSPRGTDDMANGYYSVDEVNQAFSVLVDNAFMEERNEEMSINILNIPAVQVVGDTLIFSIAEPSDSRQVSILSAVYNSQEMLVEYEVTAIQADPGSESEVSISQRTARLEKQDSGKFQIKAIWTKTGENDEDGIPAWKAAYLNTINASYGHIGYPFNKYDKEFNGITYIQYALCDINEDGTPELIICMSAPDVGNEALFTFYCYDEAEGAVMIGEEWGDIRTNFCRTIDGKDIWKTEMTNISSGLEEIYRVTLQDGLVVIELVQSDVFWEEDGLEPITWAEVNNLSLLGAY